MLNPTHPISAQELTRQKGQALTGVVQLGVFFMLAIQVATALWTLYLYRQVNDLRLWTARSQQVKTLLQRLESNLYKSESSPSMAL